MDDNQKRLKERVIQSSENALHQQYYVSPIDMFVGMNLLQPTHVEQWRKGRLPYLEQMLQGSAHKILFCMHCFYVWAQEKNLKPNLTAYLARTNGPKKELQFSVDGDPMIESFFRTHYVSPALSETKQKKLQEKLNKPPKLVVFWLIEEGECSKCKKKLHQGNLLYREADQSFCLACANFDDLEYVPNGNAMMIRRLKKKSKKFAIVVKFSRARKRYERQGILVDKEAILSCNLPQINDPYVLGNC